jgi:hypothetical protein
MKFNERSKHALFAVMAIPVGAICAALCGTILLVAGNLAGTLMGLNKEMSSPWSDFGFDLELMAENTIPAGAAVFPLAYLIFFRHVALRQVLPILGWLMLGTIVFGIPAMLLQHEAIGAIIGFLAGLFFALRKNQLAQKPGWKKNILGSTAILVTGAVVIRFGWMVVMIIGIGFAMRGIRGVEKQLKSPAVYQIAATNLALYCQSAASLNLTDEVPGAWMPQPIPQFDEFEDGKFDADSAFAIFGGGFYHYGYVLNKAQDTFSPGTNYWELSFRSENSPDVFLTRFTLPDSARLPLAVFESNVLSEYSRRIATEPANLDFHKGRIRFLLIYDTARVRQACLDDIKDIPDGWWPRLTLALWDSGRGDFTNASKAFADFVNRKPSYSHFIYLAWFYQTVNHPDEAAAAIEKAVQYPVVDSEDDMMNSEASGYTVGFSAYQSGKYDAVIKLCDVLLPIRINDDFAKGGLNALRSAAANARSVKPEVLERDSDLLPMNPYEDMDMDKLIGK